MGAQKPEPKTVKQVCTLCGVDWAKHGIAPTTDTCVALLLDEVRSLNAQLSHANRPIINPIYPQYPQPYRPYWGTYYPTVWTSSGTGNNTSISAQTSVMQGIGQPQPRNVT